ncbi:hypothetical protein KBD59_01830 [Candidatus Gracilibacteria bacterium]|nr:hypothetical protein [Candidatus Gracilibacteria bacterium]
MEGYRGVTLAAQTQTPLTEKAVFDKKLLGQAVKVSDSIDLKEGLGVKPEGRECPENADIRPLPIDEVRNGTAAQTSLALGLYSGKNVLTINPGNARYERIQAADTGVMMFRIRTYPTPNLSSIEVPAERLAEHGATLFVDGANIVVLLNNPLGTNFAKIHESIAGSVGAFARGNDIVISEPIHLRRVPDLQPIADVGRKNTLLLKHGPDKPPRYTECALEDLNAEMLIIDYSNARPGFDAEKLANGLQMSGADFEVRHSKQNRRDTVILVKRNGTKTGPFNSDLGTHILSMMARNGLQIVCGKLATPGAPSTPPAINPQRPGSTPSAPARPAQKPLATLPPAVRETITLPEGCEFTEDANEASDLVLEFQRREDLDRYIQRSLGIGFVTEGGRAISQGRSRLFGATEFDRLDATHLMVQFPEHSERRERILQSVRSNPSFTGAAFVMEFAVTKSPVKLTGDPVLRDSDPTPPKKAAETKRDPPTPDIASEMPISDFERYLRDERLIANSTAWITSARRFAIPNEGSGGESRIRERLVEKMDEEFCVISRDGIRIHYEEPIYIIEFPKSGGSTSEINNMMSKWGQLVLPLATRGMSHVEGESEVTEKFFPSEKGYSRVAEGSVTELTETYQIKESDGLIIDCQNPHTAQRIVVESSVNFDSYTALLENIRVVGRYIVVRDVPHIARNFSDVLTYAKVEKNPNGDTINMDTFPVQIFRKTKSRP